MLTRPSQLWFRFIHSNFLIYNMCWEDVEADLKLLDLTASSRVLTITSAGENALTYAMQGAERVYSVDVNPRQNHLLELKLALIKHGDFKVFYECFALGKSPAVSEIYPELRENMSDAAASFWDKHLRYFHPKGRGLFLQGGAGFFARFLNRIINQKELRSTVVQLAQESDKSRREELFRLIEHALWNGKEQNMWKNSMVLGLAGIPVSQRNAIGDMNHFIKTVLHTVFVKQQAAQNPYWGKYLGLPVQTDHQQIWLKEANFGKLQDTTENLRFATTTLFDFLKTTDQTFTHFVLLDHMDWMTEHNKKMLAEQWKLILRSAEPQAKILFRTAHHNLDFLPDFVRKTIPITQVDPQWIQHHDRVGTYTGTYVGTVQ